MQTEGLYGSWDEGGSWNAVPVGSIQRLIPAFAASAGMAMVYVASATEGAYLIDWKLAGSESDSDKPSRLNRGAKTRARAEWVGERASPFHFGSLRSSILAFSRLETA